MRTTLFLILSILSMNACAQKNGKPLKELTPGTIISGRVLDATTNKPLGPHAMIVETVANDTAAYYYTVTDKDGRFSYPLYGTDHVILVLFAGYKSVRLPLDKTEFEIKMEKAPSDYKKDRVMYELLEDYRGHATTGYNKPNNIRVPNIRIVKPEEMRKDGEGLLIIE